MKKFKKLVVCSILILGLFTMITFNVVSAANSNFEFRIQAYRGNTTVANGQYRNVSTTDFSKPWMVCATQIESNYPTRFWLELSNGTNVSEYSLVEQVNKEYKRSAYGTANSTTVYLTAENDAYNSKMYTVKGYWNPVSNSY